MASDKIVTPVGDDTTVSFHPRSTSRAVATRECAGRIFVRIYARLLELRIRVPVFIGRQNVSGQTMGGVGQRRCLFEHAESVTERHGGYRAWFLLTLALHSRRKK